MKLSQTVLGGKSTKYIFRQSCHLKYRNCKIYVMTVLNHVLFYDIISFMTYGTDSRTNSVLLSYRMNPIKRNRMGNIPLLCIKIKCRNFSLRS